MENIEKYQRQLLEQTQNLCRETPTSEATEQGQYRVLFIVRTSRNRGSQ
jgi:hypothetical protein